MLIGCEFTCFVLIGYTHPVGQCWLGSWLSTGDWLCKCWQIMLSLRVFLRLSIVCLFSVSFCWTSRSNHNHYHHHVCILWLLSCVMREYVFAIGAKISHILIKSCLFTDFGVNLEVSFSRSAGDYIVPSCHIICALLPNTCVICIVHVLICHRKVSKPNASNKQTSMGKTELILDLMLTEPVKI